MRVYAWAYEAFGTCHVLRMAASMCRKTDFGQTNAAAKPALERCCHAWNVATHAQMWKESLAAFLEQGRSIISFLFYPSVSSIVDRLLPYRLCGPKFLAERARYGSMLYSAVWTATNATRAGVDI